MSDQPIRKKTKNQIHVHQQTKRFARHFGYTPNDLLFNRGGYLSPRQTQQIRYKAMGSLFVHLGIIFAVLIFMAVIYNSPAVMERSPTDHPLLSRFPQMSSVEWLLLITVIIMVGLFILLIRKIILFRNDIRHGQVIPLVGPVNRSVVEYRTRFSNQKSYQYFIQIDQKRYEVDDELFKLCQQNQIYCAYISSNTNTIVAIEIVDESIHDMPEWMQDALSDYTTIDFKTLNKISPRD